MLLIIGRSTAQAMLGLICLGLIIEGWTLVSHYGRTH
jgi:hypothetical protein